MNKTIQNIIDFFERNAFGVCSWWGHKLGVSSSKIRLIFIYFSFITAGSPVLVYFLMALVLDLRQYFRFQFYRLKFWTL
ncbi:MAG: phage shock protein C [Sphingobacteriales bacterium]|jgi:phage shock protein C